MRRFVPLFALCALVGCKPVNRLNAKAPQIDVTPNPVLFQPIAPGKTALLTLQVRNLGNEDLHLSGDPQVNETDGDGLSEYSTPITFARDCLGQDRAAATRLTIVPGDCAEVVLKYAPQNNDNDAAALVFAGDDPQTPSLSVPIALGQPSHLQVCTINDAGGDDVCDTPTTTPPTVEFGLVAKNSDKRTKVRLKNPGTVPLTQLFVFDPAGPMGAEFQRSANAPIALDPGKSVDITVLFTPGGSGPRTGTMEVDSSDPLRPSVQIPLRGVAEGPALCADPSPLDFGQGTVGTPIDKELTLTSCGSVPVQLQTVAFDALSPPAFTSSNLPPPQTLQPGAKVSLNVRFTPDDSSDQNGALKIPNDGQTDQYVPLRGNAVFPPVCRLEANAQSVDFGQVVKGLSTQRDVTVANRGQADCNLSAIRITAGQTWFVVVLPPTSTIVLHPGDAYTATVQYSPPGNDNDLSDNGTVEFDSDDPLHPGVQVQLRGTPVAQPQCKVGIVPAKTGFGGFSGRVLQFGNVSVGHTKTLPITITNLGSANCSIGNIKFVNGAGSIIGGTICFGGTSCGDYKVVAPNPLATLPPGQNTTINVSFSPKDTNQVPQLPSVYLNFHSGDTTLTSECTQNQPSDSAAGCVDVGMSGQGDVSNLAVLPSDLDFGLVTLGCRAKQSTISLYNTGTGTTIHVTGLTLDPANAPFYISAPPTPFAIAPQGKVDIQATYKPTQAAKETATLNIASDASNATSNNPYVTVALSGTGTTDKHQVDTFNQAARPTVDLLMIIDNSGSMSDYQDSLSQQGPAFISEALAANADFHIGVTSTENDKADDPDSNASYSDKLYVGGLWGRPPLIDNSDATAANDFAKNIKVGTCCSDNRESGLESAWHVLTPNADQTAPPQGSKGFLREDARLVMLALSDEEDQSHSSTAFYSDFFKQVKGQYNAGLVSFNAIVGDPGSGCNNGGIKADAGDRYVSVVNATGGKWYSICSADWGQVAKDLALGAFQGRVQFALSRIADPATIVVTLNGNPQAVNVDYTFDQPTNSVIFKTVPPSGSTIVVNYDALCF